MTLRRVTLFTLLAVAMVLPSRAFASPYGTGGYGDPGAYGALSTPTPTPSPSTITQSIISFFSPSIPSCTKEKPGSSPQLYQIDRRSTSATLYYTPAKDPYSGYTIMYGYAETDERFSVNVQLSKSSGAIVYKVNELQPSTTYYFKVRAVNGCAPSSWSQSIKVRGVVKGEVRKFFPGIYASTALAKTYELSRNALYETSRKPVEAKGLVPSTTNVNSSRVAQKPVLPQLSLFSKIIDFLKFW